MPRPSPRSDECGSCAVRSVGFAAAFEPPDLMRLERSKVAHHYRHGQTLFFEGNPCAGVFCIRDAIVKVVKNAPRGRRKVLGLAGPGDLLGVEAVVAKAPYGHGAEILGDGVVCQIERSQFAGCLESSPAFQRATILHLAQMARASQGEQVCHEIGGVTERTAWVLHDLATRFGQRIDSRVQLALRITREDLADMIGVTSETVSRQLSELRRRGVLSSRGRTIVVEELERLARLGRAGNRC